MPMLERLYLGHNTSARINEVGQHYATQDGELARRAVHALIAVLDQIKANGDVGQAVRGMLPGHRKVQAKPFPYWVIYHVDAEHKEGFIVDIRHSKQRVMKPKAARRATREPVKPAMTRPERNVAP